MRRGLMLWRENELSAADVRARQARLQQAARSAGLDGIVVYTNHVRSAGVTYLTGFTPYWSDAVLLVLPEPPPLFATALSKRVGNWIRSVNPTSEIAHSPQPGRLVGERLARAGARRVGVVELDRLPGGLVDEIASAAPVELVDATEVFARVRGEADAAELGLARRADDIARAAFAGADTEALRAGEITGPLERAVRLAGAEECHVAVAPDLARDLRLARIGGDAALGPAFAVRLSIAYNGVWTRRTQTLSRDGDMRRRIEAVNGWIDRVCGRLDPSRPFGGQLQGEAAPPEGMTLTDWHVEAPLGTRPLALVARPGREPAAPVPYGILSVVAAIEGRRVLAARAAGLGLPAGAKETGP